jgi:uncharacterized protein Smg (DUF494 family)
VLLRQCRQFLETHLALLLQTDNQTYKSVLENIATLQDGETQAFGSANGGMRIYSEEEKLKLGTKSRGFLLFMDSDINLTESD